MLKEKNQHWYPTWRVNNYYASYSEYLGLDNKPKYKTVYMHNFLANTQPHQHTDHENHNTLDNRMFNLRTTDCSNNSKHKIGRNRNNKSGCRNVCWSDSCGRWLVQFQVDGKNKCFGSFRLEDKEQAICLANKLRPEIYKEYAGENQEAVRAYERPL